MAVPHRAARYATHLVALRDGRAVAAGEPRRIVTADLVEEVSGLPCRVIEDPETGTPLVLPAALRRPAERAGCRGSATATAPAHVAPAHPRVSEPHLTEGGAMGRDPAQMKTGELRKQAERAGLDNVDQMNKNEMIQALGGSANARQGGGQRQKDPRPQGISPQDYKNVPGNQT